VSDPNYCIIEPGILPHRLAEKHGRYAHMGVNLLKGCLTKFDYDICCPVAGDALPEPSAYDGYLVMGSEHGVNDDLPWMTPLLTFLNNAFTQRIPIVGICFGHQAVAKALGGQVERRGWNVGVTDYHEPDKKRQMSSVVYHQDQVVALPPDARLEWTSDRCINAALSYATSPCWTIQSHPEFSPEFSWDLFEDTRHDPLTDAQCDQAKREVADFEPDLGYVEARIRETLLDGVNTD